MHCLRRCFGKFHPTESLNFPAFSVVWYSSSIDRTNEYNDKKFVDRLVVTARAGHGGQGCASFVKRRSKSKGCNFCECSDSEALAIDKEGAHVV